MGQGDVALSVVVLWSLQTLQRCNTWMEWWEAEGQDGRMELGCIWRQWCHVLPPLLSCTQGWWSLKGRGRSGLLRLVHPPLLLAREQEEPLLVPPLLTEASLGRQSC